MGDLDLDQGSVAMIFAALCAAPMNPEAGGSSVTRRMWRGRQTQPRARPRNRSVPSLRLWHGQTTFAVKYVTTDLSTRLESGGPARFHIFRMIPKRALGGVLG